MVRTNHINSGIVIDHINSETDRFLLLPSSEYGWGMSSSETTTGVLLEPFFSVAIRPDFGSDLISDLWLDRSFDGFWSLGDPQEHPKTGQEDPKLPQDRPKKPHELPKELQKRPRRPQDGFKNAPRAPKKPPRPHQEAPKPIWNQTRHR